MYQNVFQTLAIETKLLSRQALQNEKWLEIGCFFIQNYVEQLSKAEKITIGHIKGLIELDEGNFIKFSSVAADRPVNAEILNSQGNSQEGRLTFNAIVANISKETNLTCFHMALERTCTMLENRRSQKNSPVRSVMDTIISMMKPVGIITKW
jgi:hypothetical protein